MVFGDDCGHRISPQFRAEGSCQTVTVAAMISLTREVFANRLDERILHQSVRENSFIANSDMQALWPLPNQHRPHVAAPHIKGPAVHRQLE